MNTQRNKPRKPMLPVLMYHGLHADQNARGRYDPVYSLHPDDFARQLDWLLQSGHQTVHIDAGLSQAASSGTSRPVLITFDDGDVSNIEIALPLLVERGMVAEFFITSDFIGQPGMLSSQDVRSLSDVGMGIVSRTVPQMQVLIVGAPIKIGVGVLVLGASLPATMTIMNGVFGASLAGSSQALLGGAR